jgi:hypothetical protein
MYTKHLDTPYEYDCEECCTLVEDINTRGWLNPNLRVRRQRPGGSGYLLFRHPFGASGNYLWGCHKSCRNSLDEMIAEAVNNSVDWTIMYALV